MIVNYLYNYGVPGKIEILSLGVGSAHPIASNATEEGRAKNRRVEFRVFR